MLNWRRGLEIDKCVHTKWELVRAGSPIYAHHELQPWIDWSIIGRLVASYDKYFIPQSHDRKK